MCTMNPKLTSGQRLMAESQHMGVEVKVAADKLDRLEYENAKLRELVRNALVFITYSGCGIDEPYEGFTTANRFCEDCRHFDTNTCAYVITQDAIELGIEVDG